MVKAGFSRARSWLRTRIRSSALTVTLSLILIALFYITNQIALQSGYSTPNEYVLSLDGLVQSVVLLFIPFLHSTWNHLAGNLLILLVLGPLVESRENRTMYVLFLMLVMLFANLLIPQLIQLLSLGLPVGPGLGASGITYALVGREVVFRSQRLYRNPEFGVDLLVWGFAVFAGFNGVISILALQAAWFSHLLGLFFGAVAGSAESKSWWSPKQLS